VEPEGRLGDPGREIEHHNHGNRRDRARSKAVITEIGPVERDPATESVESEGRLGDPGREVERGNRGNSRDRTDRRC